MSVRMLREAESHYEMHDGQAAFRVPKEGLSESTHAKIRALADGGPVSTAPVSLPSFGFESKESPEIVAQQAAEAKRAEMYPWLADPRRAAELEKEQQDARGVFDAAAAHPVATVARGIAGLVPGVNNVMAADKGIQDGLQKSAEERAALPPGIQPGRAPEAKPEEKPAETAPSPLVAPAPRLGGGDPSRGEMAQAVKGEQEAIRAKGDIDAEAARQQERVYAERQQALQAHALEDKDMQLRAKQSADSAMARVQAARDEMSKLDTSVDPGRFWASQSTGQKLIGIIGLALGAVGAGNDGVNRAAAMMNQAVDRDIEAQKAEHDFAMKKGHANLDAAQSMYSMARAATQDEIAAKAAAKATAFEVFDNQLKQVAASAASPAAKANAQLLSAQVQAKKAEFDGQAAQRSQENAYKQELLGIERIKANAKAAGNPAELKDLHASAAAAQNSLDYIGRIRGLLDKTRSVVPGKTAVNQNFGEDSARLDTATQALKLQLKEVAHLGVLSKGDDDLLKEFMGDPKAVFTLEGTKKAKLDELEALVKRAYANQRASVGGS